MDFRNTFDHEGEAGIDRLFQEAPGPCGIVGWAGRFSAIVP